MNEHLVHSDWLIPVVGMAGVAIWGWKIVSVVTLCTGLSLAEILSGLPCSGGPYYWTSLLGGRHGAVLSWITGGLALEAVLLLLARQTCALPKDNSQFVRGFSLGQYW